MPVNHDPRGVLRIATRASPLAQAQAREVALALGAPAELVPVTTRADRAPVSLAEIGGKGLFTAELEALLRSGRAHLAVHSAKDLPAEMPPDLAIVAVPRREDPRDAVVSVEGADLADLPQSARVGTSSLRRAAQVLALRPDLRIVPLRGNVGTRIERLRAGDFEAVIVAMAGLVRLGLAGALGEMIRALEVDEFVPAAGQGALAVEALAGDPRVAAIAARINHAPSAEAVAAEREIVRRLGATCHSAVGAYLRPEGPGWRGAAMVADAWGRRVVRPAASAPTVREVQESLLARLIEGGAGELLRG